MSCSISGARILAGADGDVYIQIRALETFVVRNKARGISGLQCVIESRLLPVFWIASPDEICCHLTGLFTSFVLWER